MGDLSPRPGEDLVDSTGCVVTPGLINAHHHLFQSVMKGVPAGMNASLDDWLALAPYTLWPRMDEETLRISARIGLAELALSRATTVCDHHDIFSDLYDYDPADALHALGGTVSMAVDGAAANEAADMGAALYSAFTVHRASKGVAAADPAVILHWATMGGARALGYPALGQIAPGKGADITLFDLSAPRNFGLHDPALAPMITGAAQVRHSFVNGRHVVRDGTLPGLNLNDLAQDAARVTAQLACPV